MKSSSSHCSSAAQIRHPTHSCGKTVFTASHWKWSGVRQAPGQEGVAEVELTHNWDPEPYSGGRNFGHLAFRVDDIYATCQRLVDAGVTINRPPRDGYMAFVRTPDNISIELLQDGSLPAAEPWASMPNVGTW